MIVKLEDGRIAFADDFGFAFLLTEPDGEETAEAGSHAPQEDSFMVEAEPAGSGRASKGRRRHN